ncbi:MAG TPA: hypothetical protein VH092_28815, partial [Urbifossiella sp.]|nr:hypothetical protein [Urbifossiella sp.]
MFSSRWFIPVAPLVLTLVGVVGCGGSSGPKRVSVQGTVTLDKKAIEKGTIYFKTPQTGAMDTIEVVNGEFKG